MSVFAAFYRQLASLDLDEIFSYQTTKEVRMLDRRLGMVCWLIRAVVLVYVIGYVFILREGYTETEKSVGHCVTSVNGTSYSTTSSLTRPWDAIDAVKPALEDGAAFIATTVFMTRGQTMNNFSNPSMPCNPQVASKCPNEPPLSYGKCTSGFCQQYGWQPAFSETDGTSTTKYELETADQFGVWLRASIAFPSLDDTRVFSTIGAQQITQYKHSGAAWGGAPPAPPCGAFLLLNGPARPARELARATQSHPAPLSQALTSPRRRTTRRRSAATVRRLPTTTL